GLGDDRRSLGVADDAVHPVEGEDHPHLFPPPESPAGGIVRGDGVWLGHPTARSGRAPTANAGAPRRLTTRFIPYRSSPVASAWAASPGWRRMRSTPRWTARRKLSQLACPARRAPRRGLPATRRITASTASVPRDRPRARWVAVPMCRRVGLPKRATRVMK